MDKAQPTPVGRALSQLYIEHVPSCGPRARQRMERLWQTLQGGPPPGLRLSSISEKRMPGFGQKILLGKPGDEGGGEPPARRSLPSGAQCAVWRDGRRGLNGLHPLRGALANISCVKEERVLQIPKASTGGVS